MVALILDPSDPAVMDHVCGQLKNLASAGFKYFKTDFLSSANQPGLRPHSARCLLKTG